MGLETLAIGGAVAGGLGGLVGGLAGTPDEKQATTSQTTFAPATGQELELQKQSLANYLAQLQQAQGYEQGIGGAQALQEQARQGIGSIYSGQAFQMTPQEQQNVMNLRNAMVGLGQQDVQNTLNQGMMAANRTAATRGLRGQAGAQLQGQAMQTAAQEQARLAAQANQFAAQQAINLPYQRVGAQSPFLQQGMSMADQMRIQAQQNRQAAQNPYLLNLLNQNRMAAGTTTSTGVKQGQQGSLAAGLMGMVGGGLSGAGVGANLGQGFANIGAANSIRNAFNQQNQWYQNLNNMNQQSPNLGMNYNPAQNPFQYTG